MSRAYLGQQPMDSLGMTPTACSAFGDKIAVSDGLEHFEVRLTSPLSGAPLAARPLQGLVGPRLLHAGNDSARYRRREYGGTIAQSC